MAAVAAQEQVRHLAIVDDVAIQLPFRVAVGVERLRHVGGIAHHHVRRQMGVERTHDHVSCQVRFDVEVDDLADGVNAGVGAAAGVDANALLGQRENGVFERFLHGAEAGLRLPAVKVGAVVR